VWEVQGWAELKKEGAAVELGDGEVSIVLAAM
jgi:hypothetical protein